MEQIQAKWLLLNECRKFATYRMGVQLWCKINVTLYQTIKDYLLWKSQFLNNYCLAGYMSYSSNNES